MSKSPNQPERLKVENIPNESKLMETINWLLLQEVGQFSVCIDQINGGWTVSYPKFPEEINIEPPTPQYA